MERRGVRGTFDPRAFVRANVMPIVACVAAAVSCIIVPPDAEYARYVDWDTLARLAAMIAVVEALRSVGAFQVAAHALVLRCSTMRQLVGALVATTAAVSMFATNDMALLALLPLASAALLDSGRDELLAPTFVLQGIAANLCGMLLPFGNPQNIFLTGRYSIGMGNFVLTMLPPFLVSCALIALVWLVLTRSAQTCRVQSSNQPAPNVRRVLALAVLLGVCIACALGVVPALPGLIVVFAGLIALDRSVRPIAQTDWGLLVTFAAFFVFSGNLARIDAVSQLFSTWLVAGAFVPSALLSQVISNVPAAVVLARFTGDWQGLLVGVNVGGAGTPVGSLATLIVVSQFMALKRSLPSGHPSCRVDRFWKLLLGLNLAFLAILLAVGIAAGW